MICPCPENATITTISVDDCLESIGQVQKFGIQRLKTAGVVNEIDIATTNPNLKATWVALKAAVDSSKVQFSPNIIEPVQEAGEAREFGSGNQVLNGIPIVLGRKPSPFTAALDRVQQKIVKELKTYECEKELAVFLIDENGIIWGKTDDVDTPTKFKGIPIQSFFTADKKMGMFDENDKNVVKWSFKANWSDDLIGIVPSDFDALTDL